MEALDLEYPERPRSAPVIGVANAREWMEVRTYERHNAETVAQVVADAQLLEKAGHDVRIEFVVQTSEYDENESWITGLRLSVRK